jgi:hypothetical protein
MEGIIIECDSDLSHHQMHAGQRSERYGNRGSGEYCHFLATTTTEFELEFQSVPSNWFQSFGLKLCMSLLHEAGHYQQGMSQYSMSYVDQPMGGCYYEQSESECDAFSHLKILLSH